MKRTKSIKCIACKGKGVHPFSGHNTTIENIMPHLRGGYMCSTCNGTGRRQSGKRLTLRGGNMDKKSRWRIYTTDARRVEALRQYELLGISYKMDWKDTNGYGLHVVLE